MYIASLNIWSTVISITISADEYIDVLAWVQSSYMGLVGRVSPTSEDVRTKAIFRPLQLLGPAVFFLLFPE